MPVLVHRISSGHGSSIQLNETLYRSMTRQARLRYLAAMGLVILAGFLCRTASLDVQSLWRDEVDALRFATAPWSEMVSNFTRPGWNGPLYYVLLRGWIGVAGTSEFGLRFFSVLFGILCIPLIYVIGRRLFRPTVGITSALLTSVSAYFTWYSQEAKMYTLVPALALLAIYGLRRALEGDGWHWWAVQIIATSLAFYSHILTAWLIPVQVLLAVAWWPQTRRRWQGALISIACLTLPYLPLVAWQARLAFHERETGFYPYTLTQMVVILIKAWSTGIQARGAGWAGALTGLLALAGLLNSQTSAGSAINGEERPSRSAPLRHHLALLAWLVVPLLGVWLISLRQPLFTDRYLIWSAPAFYLLVAVALTTFASAKDWTRWIVVPLLGAILATNAFNLWHQSTTPIKSDFRAAAAYVASYTGSKDDSQPPSMEAGSRHRLYLPVSVAAEGAFEDLVIFQIPHARYTFDYYFPIETYPHVGGLFTNHRTADEGYLMSQEQAAHQMEDVTAGYDVVWLIASEVPMWDDRNLVQQWLEAHGQRVAERHLTGVDVYRYELTDAGRDEDGGP